MSVGLYSGTSGLALGVGLWSGVPGFWSGAAGLIDGLGAALDLNFLAGAPLDSRITFSRGSAATLTDSTGRITYAPNNTITNSVGAASSTGVTASTASGAAPDGTNAVRLTKTDATTPRYSNWTTSFTVQGNTAYVASAYFKYDGFDTTVSLEYNNTTNFGIGWVATFNVTASGITANTPASCTSGVQAVGNGWFRVWAAFTSGTPSTPTNPFVLTRITGGTSTTVLVAWGQLEQVTYQTTPSTYVATTSAAYYGPRFDYDPVTLAPKGLLIEEQRTNLTTYSGDPTNAVWAVNAVAKTSTNNSDPSGTSTALLATANGTNTTHYVQQGPAISFTSGTAYTQSIWAKAGTVDRLQLTFGSPAFGSSQYANFYLSGAGSVTASTGGTATISQYANGWYRLTFTATATATTSIQSIFVVVITSGTDARVPSNTSSGTFYLYGAQLEAGAFATSYIPTVASQVTRSADVAAMTGTNFSSWFNAAQGTFVAEYDRVGVKRYSRVFAASNASETEQVTLATGLQADGRENGLIKASGVDVFLYPGLTPGANQVVKFAVGYRTADSAASINASTVDANATSFSSPVVTQLNIGGIVSSGQYLNGHIRSINYYPTRLSNAQLQALTA